MDLLVIGGLEGREEPVVCTKCGACCVAPDISALNKPAGVRCRYLTEDNCCRIYEERPDVGRNYRPDETCLSVQAPTLAERVDRYRVLFGLEAENSR